MPCKQYVFLVYQCHHFDEHKYTETAFKYDNKEALLIHVLKQGYFQKQNSKGKVSKFATNGVLGEFFEFFHIFILKFEENF